MYSWLIFWFPTASTALTLILPEKFSAGRYGFNSVYHNELALNEYSNRTGFEKSDAFAHNDQFGVAHCP